MKRLVEESLNEFQRGLDPAKALGIGYGNKPKTKAWKVLDFIGSKGESGASLTEIQHFIWTEINGNPEKEFWEKSKVWGYKKQENPNGILPVDVWGQLDQGTRKTRGYWATNLYGGSWYGPGLLRNYCTKNAEGRWVLDHMPKPGENIF